MSVTLDDIASKANVSKSTVSLALNGSNKVNDETRKKIKKIAHEMNYVPNVIGLALKKKVTKTIGLVIPELNNHFFPRLVQEIKNELKKEDYTLILGTSNHKMEEENRYINVFKSRQVDGVIFAAEETNNPRVNEFAQSTPTVFINRNCDREGIPVVKSDLVSGMYQATEHLIELGHENIGYVGDFDERKKGYEQALRENNINVEEKFEFQLTEFNNPEIIKNFPTALVCFNDETAYRTILMLSHLGLKVPEDISVCGLDNLRLSEIYNPALTTVDIPVKKMVQTGVELLFKLINGDNLQEEEYFYQFETELIVRKSTKHFQKNNLVR